MPRLYKPDPRSKRHISYNKKDIERALQDKRVNNLSFRAAGKKHNIDYTVLYRHETRNMKKLGGQTVLSADVENMIVENLNTCAEWGYPMDTYDLRLLVKMYLDNKGVTCKKFSNNMPGPDFAIGFLKRHKSNISERYAQNIKRVRADITAESMSKYFDELENTLKDVPPANIINYDETNLTDNPGRKKVIVKRGSKYPERIMNCTKCSISIMIAGTAAGHLFPPYVIYKSQHLYDLWKNGGPKGTRYNRTVSGWMDLRTFEDWIKTIVLPYARNIEGTLYVIGDNLSCHLSLDTIQLCRENDVHLIFLPPNTTHLTQPLDVAFFRPLKMAWREILLSWKKKDGAKEKSLPKSVFPKLLSALYSKIEVNSSNNLKSGFKKTGIFPLNREQVLSRLPDYSKESNKRDVTILNDSVVEMLKSLRYGQEETQRKKKRLDIVPGKSVDENDVVTCETKKKKVVKASKTTGKTKTMKTKGCKQISKDLIDIVEIQGDYEASTTTKGVDGYDLVISNGPDRESQEDGINGQVNKGRDGIEPKAGPSNLLMCRVCHCLKPIQVQGESWVLCNICKNKICPKCSGDGVLPYEFICHRCLIADSDDSCADEDFNPIKSGYDKDESDYSD